MTRPLRVFLLLACALSTAVACSERARRVVDSDAAVADLAADVDTNTNTDGASDTTTADAGADLTPDDAAPDGTDAATDADGGASAPFQTGVQVETTSGQLQGEEDGDLRVFRGIPYAEPPVGDDRLRAPRPVQPWDGVRDATDYGASCMQPFSTVFNVLSEDCLTLNVWGHRDAVERPVMVWIYGGGFIIGESAMPTYDGADLATDADVVLVTINYRLGVLSNLALPELRDEDPQGAVGNMGLLDQLEALRWVKANAPAFGGDPDNVTVFGESAGGISTCALMGAPAADDLFHKAIVQSGNCHLFSSLDASFMGAGTVFDLGESVVEQLGCADASDRLQCLRGLDARDFVDVVDLTALLGGLDNLQVALGPTVDGVVLPELPYERLAAGRAPERPVIFGSNGNEGALFTQTAVLWTRADLEDAIGAMLPDPSQAAAVAALYPATTYPIHKDAYAAFVGEALFNCNSYHAARAQSGKAWYYHLMQGPLITMTFYGPLHSADVFYVFGNFLSSGVVPGPVDLLLSDAMQQAWGTFAWLGVPQFDPVWPVVATPTTEHLELDLVSSVETEFRAGRCDALQALGVLP